MNSISMETPMEQNDDPPHQHHLQRYPHQDYKITNSNENDSCSDSLDNSLNLNLSEESNQIVLITLVSQEPAIFNPKHEDYRNINKKDELWTTMSKQVGWPDIYCKNKWKAIRDQYCRELKRTRTNCNAKIKWKYFKHLEFLRPYALSRKYRTNNKRNKEELLNESDIADQEESSNTQQESIKTTFSSTNNEINSTIKIETENWSICESSDLLNDSGDITSQIIMQLSQQTNNKSYTESGVKGEEGEHEEEVQEIQDDEDDDPIHTFLNIESYFEKELITLVHKTNILYDNAHPSYKNTKVKHGVWEEISRKLKRTVRQCRLKWKALRDQYIREHKRLKNMGSCKTLPRWKHFDAMNFLEQFIKEKCEFNFVAALEDPNPQEMPNHNFEQEEMINLPNKNEINDMNQYDGLLGDDDTTSGIYTQRLYSPEVKSPEDQQKSETHKINHLLIEEVTEVTEAQSSSNTDETAAADDEVGAFFKAVAIKIRKANMSTLAFTELQIDILKVITSALKD